MPKRRTVIRKRRKMQRPIGYCKWNKRIDFYHNQTSQHFLLGVARRGDFVAGHDMTTHPSLRKKDNKPKKKYLELANNPNPNDSNKSYIDKKLRKGIKIHFEDSNNRRLTRKKNWKLDPISRIKLKRLDRGKLKQ